MLRNARRRGINYLGISLVDDSRILIAESHLFTNQSPSLTVLNEVTQFLSTRQVSRIAWSDRWRPNPDTDPERWAFIDSKGKDLATVKAAIEQAGCLDGRIRNKSVDEVKSLIEQILLGVTL